MNIPNRTPTAGNTMSIPFKYGTYRISTGIPFKYARPFRHGTYCLSTRMLLKYAPYQLKMHTITTRSVLKKYEAYL